MKTTILPDGSAFSTAVILTKEEIAKLPIKERPISARISSNLYHDVWEAIGEASMTFNKDAGNEVFNIKQASKICVDLLFKIADELEQAKLDAMKEGMRRAADIVADAEMAKQPWNQDEHLLGVKRCDILRAAEQLTKKDLI